MILNKLFKGLVLLLLCVASATSCLKYNGDNTPTKQPSEYTPGEDFFIYANAEWLESLKNANQQQSYGYFHDINEANNARLQTVKNAMPEYKMLKQGAAKREANFDASNKLIEDLALSMLAEVNTREDLYVFFGKAIRLGAPLVATLHTAICREDNTFGYYLVPPTSEMGSATAMNLHEPTKRLSRYEQSTRSGKTTIDYILEGVGLDPKYYLHDEVSEALAETLEEMDETALKKSIASAILTELISYCSDEYAMGISKGVATTVEEYIDKFIETDLGYFTSYYFSQKYPTNNSEAAFITLGNDLIASFRKRLENNQWLSPATQQAAIEKLDYMGKAYGTPKKWIVTDMPQLKGELLVSDVLEIKKCRYEVIKSLLGKSVKEYAPIHYMFYNPLESFYTYVSNAFYDPSLNSFYVLPPFMLEPAYTTDMDECKFYAFWGFILGHEITHGFDQLGAPYDKTGEKNDWWTASDAAKFDELNALRIQNINTYEIVPGMKANGEMTVLEDVADLGGFNIAYDLWVSKLKERGVEGDELNEMKKQFFLNFAVLFSEKMPVDQMVERAEFDIHSAGHIRINSVVQHIDDWYELFDVTEGDALYLAPEKRITIW